MDARSRRKLEMGSRALDFSRAHPDESPGYQAVVSRLEERLARAKLVAAQQRSGLLSVRSAAARKLELRRTMREAHLAHLAQVARAAAREAPEVGQKFVFRPGTTTYVAFQTTARGFAAEAETHRELLVRHGLVESVLADLGQALQQFDAAMESGAEARAAHVSASAELRTLSDEVVQAVKVLDRFNRLRFRQAPERLAAWRSISSVVATPRGGKAEPEPGPGSGDARGTGARSGPRLEGRITSAPQTSAIGAGPAGGASSVSGISPSDRPGGSSYPWLRRRRSR